MVPFMIRLLWRSLTALAPRSRSRVERDIDAELESHMRMRYESLRRSGMSHEQASSEALDRFGDLAGVRNELVSIGMRPWHRLREAILLLALLMITLLSPLHPTEVASLTRRHFSETTPPQGDLRQARVLLQVARATLPLSPTPSVHFISTLGAVRAPRTWTVGDTVTLTDMIRRAGGPTPDASGRVFIVDDPATATACGDEDAAMVVDLRQILAGQCPDPVLSGCCSIVLESTRPDQAVN